MKLEIGAEGCCLGVAGGAREIGAGGCCLEVPVVGAPGKKKHARAKNHDIWRLSVAKTLFSHAFNKTTRARAICCRAFPAKSKTALHLSRARR